MTTATTDTDALRAAEQCIADFIEAYSRDCAKVVLDLAVKSLRDDALPKLRERLKYRDDMAAKVSACREAGWFNLNIETKGKNAGRLYGIPPHEPTAAFVGHAFVDDWSDK